MTSYKVRSVSRIFMHAHATEVKLIFQDAWSECRTLIIEDNGAAKRIKGFMRLSSVDRIHNLISISKKLQGIHG